MHPIFLILILVGGGAAGYYYYRRKAKPDEVASEVARKAKGVAATAKGWLRMGKPRTGTEQFVAWAANLPEVDEAFKTWLEGLSPEEAKTLSEGASSFGSGLQIELAWLLDAQLDNTPELKQEIEKAITLYCQAYWKAAQVQDDARVFAAFRAWQDAPSTRKPKELTQQLFAKLMEAELVSVPTELYLASEKEREAYIVQAISDFAEQDKQAFNAILKEALARPVST